MIVVGSHDNLVLYVRVEPGEDVIESMKLAVESYSLGSAAVVAAAGSAELVRYGVVKLVDGVPIYEDPQELTGAIELTGIQGHIGREASGKLTFHLHGSFALADGSVVAGHVYEALALVTAEITLIGTYESEWVRSAEKYRDGHLMPILTPRACVAPDHIHD